MDLGSQLSKMFGDHKSIEIVAEKNTSNNVQSMEHYRSSTTNSFGKCINEIAGNFPSGVVELAYKAIEKHDQNNFDETVIIGDVLKFNEDTGQQYLAGKHVLRMVGKYEFKWFAHCKSIEMWVELRCT
jgi:hypothetical protein